MDEGQLRWVQITFEVYLAALQRAELGDLSGYDYVGAAERNWREAWAALAATRSLHGVSTFT